MKNPNFINELTPILLQELAYVSATVTPVWKTQGKIFDKWNVTTQGSTNQLASIFVIGDGRALNIVLENEGLEALFGPLVQLLEADFGIAVVFNQPMLTQTIRH